MELLLLGLLLAATSGSGFGSGSRPATASERERLEVERLQASYRRRNGLSQEAPYVSPAEKAAAAKTTTVNVGGGVLRFDINQAIKDGFELAKKIQAPAPTPQGQRTDPTADYDWANRP